MPIRNSGKPIVCDFVATSVKGVIVSGIFGLKIMSSISCCVLYVYLFVLMYDIEIKFNIILIYNMT